MLDVNRIVDEIKKANTRNILTVVMTSVVLCVLVLVFTVEIPERNRDLAIATVGTFVGYFGGVVTFWFGTSKGSSDKQKELNHLRNINQQK